MKRTLSLLVIAALLLTGVASADTEVSFADGQDASPAVESEFADGSAVYADGETEPETPPQSTPETIALGRTYNVPGYVRVQPLSFEYVDDYPQFLPGTNGDISADFNENRDYYAGGNRFYVNMERISSGENADFAWFEVDITNLSKETQAFDTEATVQYIFDNDYIIDGWLLQFNYDYDAFDMKDGSLTRAALDGENMEPADMLYTNHYIFGATLPNAVVTGTKPLAAVITLGEHAFTYNIRK